MENIFITEDEWNDPSLQHLMELVIDGMIYYNDVISFEKEWLEANKDLEQTFNIVAVITIIENCPIEEAMEKARILTAEIENKTLETKEKLLIQESSENMKIFIDRVPYLISGTFESCIRLDRYKIIE